MEGPDPPPNGTEGHTEAPECQARLDDPVGTGHVICTWYFRSTSGDGAKGGQRKETPHPGC